MYILDSYIRHTFGCFFSHSFCLVAAFSSLYLIQYIYDEEQVCISLPCLKITVKISIWNMYYVCAVSVGVGGCAYSYVCVCVCVHV